MKVILLGELRGKGGEGDIVDVAQGFAENYLFPNKIAQPATPGNIKQLEERRHNIEKREAERIANAEATKAALDGKSVTVDAKIGEEGQLFGSVTPAQIADAVKAQLGIEVDRKRVGRGNNIKTSGKHAVEVNLYREIRGGARGRGGRGDRRGRGRGDRGRRRGVAPLLFNAPPSELRISTITAGQEYVRLRPGRQCAARASFCQSKTLSRSTCGFIAGTHIPDLF